MRGAFVDIDLSMGELTLDGVSAHHLIKVIRIKLNQEIYLLNGKGQRAIAKVTEILKKSLTIEITELNSSDEKPELTAYIGSPKKEAAEEILKKSVELGVSKIVFFTSEFTQSPLKLKQERMEQILSSALVQSQCLWLPEVIFCEGFSDSLELMKNERALGLLTLKMKSSVTTDSPCVSGIIVGPEGGFSEEEENQMLDLPNIKAINIPGPIMRAPTALCCGVGFIKAQYTHHN